MYDPATVGLNAQDIDTAADSNILACKGYNQCTLEIFHDYAAATGVQFNVTQVDEDGTEFYVAQSSDGGSGTVTLARRLYSYVHSAGADRYLAVQFPINCHRLKIESLLGTGSPSGDKATVRVRFAVV
jgi:hypothetical protein